MQLISKTTTTRRQHGVTIKIDSAKEISTSDRVTMAPQEVEIIWERNNDGPVVLSGVRITGPAVNVKKHRWSTPITLGYAPKARDKHEATIETWRDQPHYRPLPIWVQRLVEDNWPQDI